MYHPRNPISFSGISLGPGFPTGLLNERDNRREELLTQPEGNGEFQIPFRFNMDYEEFARQRVLNYPSPHVRIQVKPSPHVYHVSRQILCRGSNYFRCMFMGGYSEGEQQAAELHEIEGVVKVRSFEMLLQWLHTRRVYLRGTESAQEKISAWIEFSRLADMCSVTGAEWHATSNVQNILITNPAPPNSYYQLRRDPNTNIHCLTSQHVQCASKLPDGHPLRALFARASVEAYLRRSRFKFAKEAHTVPNFGSDLLREVRTVVCGLKSAGEEIYFTEPITGIVMRINSE